MGGSSRGRYIRNTADMTALGEMANIKRRTPYV